MKDDLHRAVISKIIFNLPAVRIELYQSMCENPLEMLSLMCTAVRQINNGTFEDLTAPLEYTRASTQSRALLNSLKHNQAFTVSLVLHLEHQVTL